MSADWTPEIIELATEIREIRERMRELNFSHEVLTDSTEIYEKLTVFRDDLLLELSAMETAALKKHNADADTMKGDGSFEKPFRTGQGLLEYETARKKKSRGAEGKKS
jgi:hypothetical protein